MGDNRRTCTSCGTALDSSALGGLCPKCLLQAGLEGLAGQHLHVRCPNCQAPIEIVDDDSAQEITCPSCDSRISLAGDATAAFVSEHPGRVGRFELLERVGIGAFGSVWKARDPELDRIVAIKIPRRNQVDDDDAAQFLREARAAGGLRHPSIVAVHEVGRDLDRLYIVSDFIEGTTLGEYLTARPFAPREAARLCREIAEALQHAHDRGVIHRDLKPSNIMLDRLGLPHVMDFGLAKREAAEMTMTVEGQILGTPAYMSPEQARGEGNKANARSDVYSLGVILFELLTGEKPFRGSSRMLLNQVLNDDAPSPRKLRATVPIDLETICLKCLEKEPGARYPTAKALSEELSRYLDEVPILARPIGPVQRGWRWCRRNPLVAGLTVAVLGSLVVGLGATLWQWREAETARTFADERRKETAEALDESEGRLARLYVERGLQRIDGDPLSGLPWLVEALRTEPPGSSRTAIHRLRMGLLLRGLPELKGFWSGVTKAQFSDDGTRLAVVRDRELMLYSLPDMHARGPIVHAEPIKSIAFTKDGRRIATLADSDNPMLGNTPVSHLQVWDTTTGAPATPRIDAHEPRVRHSAELRFSPDGARLLTIHHAMHNRWYTRMAIRVYDAKTLALISDKFAYHHHDESLEYRISSDGTRVLTLQGVPFVGKEDSEEEWTEPRILPRVWDIATGEAVGPHFSKKFDYTSRFDASPDLSRVALSYDFNVQIWDPVTGQQVQEIEIGAYPDWMRVHPDGMSLFTFTHDRASWWDIATRELKHRWDAARFALDPECRHAAYADEGSGYSYVVDLTGPEPKDSSYPHSNWDAFNPDGSRFVTEPFESAHSSTGMSTNQVITEVRRSTDARRLSPPWQFRGNLSRGGQFFLGSPASSEGNFCLWDIDQQKTLAQRFPAGSELHLRDAAFSEDASTIVVLAKDQSVTTWDALTGRQKSGALKLEGDWRWMVLSPDASLVAAIGNGPNPPRLDGDDSHQEVGAIWRESRQLQVWKLADSSAMTPLVPIPQGIESVDFTRDGRRLIVTELIESFGTEKQQAKPRDVTNIHRIEVSTQQSAPHTVQVPRVVEIVAMSRDGKQMLLTRDDRSSGVMLDRGDAQLWNIDPLEPASEPMISEDGAITTAAMSDDGRTAIIGTTTGIVEIWDAASAKRRVGGLRHPAENIQSIRLLNDGKGFLAEAGVDEIWSGHPMEVRGWALDGKPLVMPMTQPGMMHSKMALNRKETILAAANSQVVQLWDAQSGLKLMSLQSYSDEDDDARQPSREPHRSVVFSADGRRLYLEGHSSLWVVPVGEIMDGTPESNGLEALAGMVSGHRIDTAGGYVPLTRQEYDDAWKVLSGRVSSGQ